MTEDFLSAPTISVCLKKRYENLQLNLFEYYLHKDYGSIRVFIGDLAEKLVAKLTNGIRLKTDSQYKYCPDIYLKDKNCFLECKTVGKTNSFLVYKHRLDKDIQFSKFNNLFYIIVHHSAKFTLPSFNETAAVNFLSNIRNIYLIPFTEIEDKCNLLTLPKYSLNYYRVPINLFEKYQILTGEINE